MALVEAADDPRRHRLRVGVVADRPLQPRWVIDAFARVAGSDFAAITAIVIAPGRRERLPWPVAAYASLDRMAFGADPSAALPLAEHVPHGRLLPALSPPQLAALDLDVAFAIGNFDDRLLDGVARYGVWRFCFGAGDPAALAGFGEVARGEPLTRSGLEVRLAGDAPRMVYSSSSRTFPHSVARNRAQILPKTAEFAHRALRELHRSGPSWLARCRLGGGATPLPGNAALLGDLGRIGGRVLRRALSRALHVEQWFLAFRFGAPAGAPVPADLAGFSRIVPPKDRDWADPFPVEQNGRYYVFFEERPFDTGKGHIAVIEIEPGGRWSRPQRVLERDHHLSYPFLLEHEGALYMIPESADSRSVELYRCTEFPLRWRRERVLLAGVRCADATLHRAGDRWWMFASAAPGESPCFDDELHLYHADGLAGDWQPHARNPVKSDPRSARPAGSLYIHNGSLYRPSQVCVPRYGAGLALNRVHRLTPYEYSERLVQRIEPAGKDGLLGLHTVNRAGPLEVVDGFMQRRRF